MKFGGYWLWTLNPYFDIRLTGSFAFLGSGFKDIVRLATATSERLASRPVTGNDLALKGEIRFRARF